MRLPPFCNPYCTFSCKIVRLDLQFLLRRHTKLRAADLGSICNRNRTPFKVYWGSLFSHSPGALFYYMAEPDVQDRDQNSILTRPGLWTANGLSCASNRSISAFMACFALEYERIWFMTIVAFFCSNQSWKSPFPRKWGQIYFTRKAVKLQLHHWRWRAMQL